MTATGANRMTRPCSTATGTNRIAASRSLKLRTSSVTPAVVPCATTDRNMTPAVPSAHAIIQTSARGWRTRSSGVSTTRTRPLSKGTASGPPDTSAPGSARPVRELDMLAILEPLRLA